jgi:hypothetical protein
MLHFTLCLLEVSLDMLSKDVFMTTNVASQYIFVLLCLRRHSLVHLLCMLFTSKSDGLRLAG